MLRGSYPKKTIKGSICRLTVIATAVPMDWARHSNFSKMVNQFQQCSE